MVKDMITNLKSHYGQDVPSCLSIELLQNAKTKAYIPVMKRQTCDSLEDKIKQYVKRKKIQINMETK